MLILLLLGSIAAYERQRKTYQQKLDIVPVRIIPQTRQVHIAVPVPSFTSTPGAISQERRRHDSKVTIVPNWGPFSPTSSRGYACVFEIKVCNFHYQLLWVVTPADEMPIKWPVTLNSIHQNHNIPSDKGTHSLMIKSQIPTEASNGSTKNRDFLFKYSNLRNSVKASSL